MFQGIGFDGMNILFATGGTGGHISVALSLAKELSCKSEKYHVKFSLNFNSFFEKKLKKNKFDYVAYSLKMPNSFFTFTWISFIIDNIKAFAKIFCFITKFKPDVIVGFGSYASIPAVFAGFLSLKKIKIILHEQNVIPGKANRALSLLASKVAVSFKASENLFRRKAVYTGNFVDKDFFIVTKDNGVKELKLKSNKFTIVVVGGSQGARAINQLFIKAANCIDDSIKKNIQVIHICGAKDYDNIRQNYDSLAVIDYQIIAFSDKMPLILAASDLIISRAGATSIAEISAVGRPSILIPYPYAGNHQKFNAQVLEDNKAAIVFDEGSISEQILADKIVALINDRQRLKFMAQASKNLADPESTNRMEHLINISYENTK